MAGTNQPWGRVDAGRSGLGRARMFRSFRTRAIPAILTVENASRPTGDLL